MAKLKMTAAVTSQVQLAEGIYSGYTSALGDKYTVYYDEDETKALMESTSGTFSGVGATLTKDADTGYATIVNVYEDSPAEKAGLKAGDILEKIDDHEVGDEQLDTVVSWIKGNRCKDYSSQRRRRTGTDCHTRYDRSEDSFV